MPYKITFTRPAMLFAGMTCASTDSTRYYLRGVQVEPSPSGGLLLVATDGHRLSLAHDAGATVEGTLPERGVILPTVNAAMAKLKEGTRAQAEVVTYDGRTFAVDGQTWHAPAIDGTFPDWRRILPDVTTPGTGAGFNPRYLADFAKVAAAFGEKNAPLVLTGASTDAPHWVQLSGIPEWRGVLMPKRHTCETPTHPAYV